MKAKTILILNLAVAITRLGAQPAVVSSSAAGATTNALSLEWILDEVRARNPALRSARATGAAMDARVPQARAWDDPRVGVDVERHGTTRLFTYTDTEWMASQTLPLSGKNRRRADAARAEASGAWVDVRRRELELFARARAAFFLFANAHTQIDLNLKNEALLKQFAELSREKYTAGTRSQSDALMAETELAKNAEVRRDLERTLWEAQTRLNTLMNHPADAPLPRPAELTLPTLDLKLDNLQATALRHRPELQSAQFKIKAAEARHALAKREWFPDPEIRVEARQYNGSGRAFNEYDTGIFFSFPWANRGKYKAAIAEADSVRESAGEELAALQAETLGMVREQVKKIETALHHYHLFHEKIVPLARQTVEAARIAYANDKASLLELLSAQRTLRESEAMRQQHLTDHRIALAEMEALMGVSFSAPPANSSTPK